MEDLLNPIINNTLYLRSLNFQKNNVDLILSRKQRLRKNSLDQYFFAKRLETKTYSADTFNINNNKEDSIINENKLLVEISVLVKLFKEESTSVELICAKGIHLQIFNLLEKEETFSLPYENILELLFCLKKLIYVKNEVILEEIQKRRLILSLLRILKKHNDCIKEELLLCIGHILSDVSYKNFKIFQPENIILHVVNFIQTKHISPYLLRISFHVIICIIRGKTDYTSEFLYETSLKHLWNDNFEILNCTLSYILLLCKNENFKEFARKNYDYLLRIVEIIYKFRNNNILIQLAFQSLELLLRFLDITLMEMIVEKPLLKLFSDTIMDENLGINVLNCLLYLSCSSKLIINSIINEKSLIKKLFITTKYPHKKSVVFEILFNLLDKGDHISTKSLLLETPILKIIKLYFKDLSLQFSQHINIAVKSLCTMLEYDEYMKFYQGNKIKEILEEFGILNILESIIINCDPKINVKMVEELLLKLSYN